MVVTNNKSFQSQKSKYDPLGITGNKGLLGNL